MQLLDFVFGLFVLVSDHPLHQLARLVPKIVVAHVNLNLVVVHIHDVGADVV